MRWDIPQLPQYAFMAWCLVKHRDNFTFYLLLPKRKWGEKRCSEEKRKMKKNEYKNTEE
jgi:hypothetical protein